MVFQHKPLKDYLAGRNMMEPEENSARKPFLAPNETFVAGMQRRRLEAKSWASKKSATF